MIKKYLLFLFLFLYFFNGIAFAELEVSIEAIKKVNKLGHAVPAVLTVKNTGVSSVEIPQYLVPFFDFDLKVEDSFGNELSRSYSVFNLAYLKPVKQDRLKAGEEHKQKITDLRQLYSMKKTGRYKVQAIYYPGRNKEKAVYSKPIYVNVGNVAGDQGFLIFSDTAYIKKGFAFTTVYPNGNYYLREFSNNYYIFGLRSSWFQVGLGYADGLYSGLKWQVLSEKKYFPAVGLQFTQWKSAREVINREREIFGYWSEDRGTKLTFSKRLPYRSHIHFGMKRHEVYTKLEGVEPRDSLYLLNMIALDQSYDFGMFIYELDYDTVHNFRSEAFEYRGFPSWEPQVSLGLLRYRVDQGAENVIIYLALHFYADNFLLGYNF